MDKRGTTTVSPPRVLLVYKQSTITRLGDDDMAKLINAGVTNLNRLESAHTQHQGVLESVRQAIGADCIAERWVGDCTKKIAIRPIWWSALVVMERYLASNAG